MVQLYFVNSLFFWWIWLCEWGKIGSQDRFKLYLSVLPRKSKTELKTKSFCGSQGSFLELLQPNIAV